MSFDLYNPTEEHAMLRRTVRDFVQREVEPQALEHNRLEKFNVPLFKRAGELGLLGLTVSPEYGGTGLDATAAVIVHEELAASDPAFTLSYLAHSMLFVNNFFVNANADQRARVLPKVSSGEWIAGMGMSEPAVGTDVLGMKTKAVRQGDKYILDGRKMWITNGCVDDQTLGDCFLVYAKTGERQVSSFLVEKGMPGFSLGQKIKDKTGMRASCTAELVFDHCEVPASNRLGNEGESMLHMMRNLEIERVTLAAMSLGIARRSLEVMVRYANDRIAFGQPLVAFGQIQRYIGDSYAKTQAARAYTYLTASRMALDSHGNRVDSDGVKLFASTVGKEVADNAMQVLGGYGYVGEYVVERLWRDAKLLEIGGGTLEAHQKNIARDLFEDDGQLVTAQLGYVLLYVNDVDKTVAFYTAALGLKLRFQQGTYVEMETGGTALGFVTREFAQTHFKDKLPPPGQGSSEIGFVVPKNEVDATYKKALKAGAVAVLDPEDKPWGQRISYVRDPDGHLVEICSPVGA